MIDQTLSQLLAQMADARASDLYLSPGAPPSMKADGVTRHLGELSLSTEQLAAMAASIMNERQSREFESTQDLQMALQLDAGGRFRLSIFRQRGEVAMAVRYISASIPSLDSLHLPSRLKELVMMPRGLVLVVGAAGSGKSTTLAAMIDHRNRHMTGHILTVEEPIEYLHQHRQSVVDQREVGLDTPSFEAALKNAMREAPDVIMIGEIRDRESMQQAITYAETGHLCRSSLHANNANQTIDRILNFFPDPTMRHQVLMDLSLNLQAVIALRLITGSQGYRLPAVELMLHSPFVSDLIQRGEIDSLKEAMQHGTHEGMFTFDQSLYQLYVEGKIDRHQALENADSHNDLALRMRLSSPVGQANAELSLEPVTQGARARSGADPRD